MKRGFTLTEMLLVIAIIAIMAGLALSGLAGAVEQAREARTRSIIAKLDQLVMEQYENYRTRAVPIRVPVGTTPPNAARFRLYALRDLMRMELPERITDLSDGPAAITVGGTTITMSQPSALKSYRRIAQRICGASWATTWSDQYQGAECLYLIISRIQDGDKNALDFFTSDEIGDTDGDGMKEILDGWGQPIEFLRWAPGYTEQPGPDGQWGVSGVDDDKNGIVDDIEEAGWPGSDDIVPNTTQTKNFIKQPDPFDPVKCDPRWSATIKPYALFPLIISGGRDKKIDVAMKGVDGSGNAFRFAIQSPPDDQYFIPTVSGQYQFGSPVDFDGDGLSVDDITNHNPVTP